MTGIYIHVPFCAEKCPYCNFYSCRFSMSRAALFKDAVIRNIKAYPSGIKADTIYFGGGTPSLLPSAFLSEIIYEANKHFDIRNPEITLEVNPCTVNRSKLSELKSAGINRLSIGVQSASDSELKFLGRKHSFKKAEEIIILADSIGFRNISCDMMIGLPGQTKKQLEYTIKKYLSLPVQHISSYILKIEKNTSFYRNSVSDLLPDDDTVADLYLFMVEKLNSAGFIQYEISNFSKSGFESRHNLKYWECKEYIGIGPSAHSYFNGKRYAVPDSLELFTDSETQTEEITDHNPGQTDERIMLGLRLNKGICVDDFPDEKEAILKKAAKFEKAGFVKIENNVLSLTPKGFLVSNSIISDLIC
ncbi:MAG: radical SAM family heme chaperone HemW [Porcipelethomonas sp.]